MANKYLIWVAFLALLAVGCAPDAPVSNETATSGESCRITHVVDGDTLDLKCTGHVEERIRIMGYDTPETYNAQCAAEKRLGDIATNRLRHLAVSKQVTRVERNGQDRYGRTLARIWLGNVDLAQTFITENLAVRYNGGRRINWCTLLASAGMNQ